MLPTVQTDDECLLYYEWELLDLWKENFKVSKKYSISGERSLLRRGLEDLYTVTL